MLEYESTRLISTFEADVEPLLPHDQALSGVDPKRLTILVDSSHLLFANVGVQLERSLHLQLSFPDFRLEDAVDADLLSGLSDEDVSHTIVGQDCH